MKIRKRKRRKRVIENYAILCMGALGDMILHYHKTNGIFSQIASFKEDNPKSQIKVICCSSNKHTQELFKENPDISEVHHVPWALQSKGVKERNAQFQKLLVGWKCLNTNNRLPGARFTTPQVHLSKEEEAFVKSIQNKGKYILIHPFTSDFREVIEDEYVHVIDMLIDELNYNVVVVGGTYKKSFQHCEPSHAEVFNYKRDKLYNLVNNANVRTAVRLAKGAYGYFGTWSAFYCACWDCKTHPMVLCTEKKGSTIDLVNKRRFGKAKYKKIITPAGWHRYPDFPDFDYTKIYAKLESNREKIKQEIIEHLGKNDGTP